ncbi:MAG: ABC transporter permease [Acidobacteriota bacterium]
MSATTTWGELDPTPPSFWRILRLETWTELVKLWRLPMYTLPTLTFPLMFYIIFGVVISPPTGGSVTMATYLIATYGVFGVMGASLFGLGVGLATERGQGWMVFKRATPMPPMVHILARSLVAMLFGAIVVAELFIVGMLFGGVEMSAATIVSLSAILIVSSLPFTAIGLALGYLCKPNSAPAVINMLYLPLSVASGLWIPIQVFPEWLQSVATFLPPFHAAQLALDRVGVEPLVDPLVSVAVLVVTTVAFVGITIVAYRRDDGATWG